MSTATSPMPNHGDAMGDTDILDELFVLLEGNGDIPDTTRNRILAKALFEVIRRVRKIERESPAAIVRRNPVKILAITTLAFVLMHEFATYIGIGVLIRAAAKVLGVPIP